MSLDDTSLELCIKTMLCDVFEKSRATLSVAAQLILGISGTQMGHYRGTLQFSQG